MELALVYRHDSPAMIGFVKELLTSNDIAFMVRNEDLQSVIGIGALGGYNPITGPIEILVREEDLARSQELLQDLEEAAE